MAPEQAEGRVDDVGPLTDVYGLGAVLYESLTGRPPFKAATPLETVRQVAGLDPVPPSRLQPQVPRDLELVCLHCLEKDPRKRYATAAALEEDLQRFLEGRPILARATPPWERAWKWARRRPLAAASSVAAAASLLCIVIVWAIFTIRLGEARQLAENNASEREHQRILAEQNRDKTLQVVDRFLTRVGETKLADNPELSDLRKDLLADALEFSKSFLNKKENADPLIRLEAAHAAQRTYRIYNMMGLSKEQYLDTELAVDLFRKLVAEFPENAGYRYDLSSSLNALGVWYTGNGKTADPVAQAEGYLLEAKVLRTALANQYPAKPEYRAALARTHASLANLCRRVGTRPQEAQQNYQTAMEILHGVLDEHPSFENRTELAVLDNRIANFYYAAGNFEGTERIWEEAIQLYEANLQERPNDRSTKENLADSCQYLGVACTDLGKVDRAREVTLRALAILQQLAREMPRHAGIRNSLAMCFNNLGRVYRRAGQPKEELAALENSLHLFEELVSERPREPAFLFDFGKVSTNVSVALLNCGRVNDAVRTCSKALEILEPLAKAHPQEFKYTYEFARTCRLFDEAQVLSLVNEPTRSNSSDWIARTIALLDAMPTHTMGSPEGRTLLAESLVAHAIVNLQKSKSDEALAQLDRAEKLGFADSVWLKTVRTLGQIQIVQGPSTLETIQQLDRPAYLSGPSERYLFLALIYCNAGEILKTKNPELAEKADRRAADLMTEYLAQGKLLPPSDRMRWPQGLRTEPRLRPLYAVLSGSSYANLSARAIAARSYSMPQLQTVGDGRGPSK
jgi:eukaryotic-like serine/threonine-protein kinase